MGGADVGYLVPPLIALMQEEGWPLSAETPDRLRAELYLGITSGGLTVLGIYGEPGVAPGGRLAGIVGIQACDQLPLGPHLFVRYLYVYPAWRRTKASRILLTELAHEMLAQGYGDWIVVAQSTGRLRRSYRRLGFLPLTQSGANTVAGAARALGLVGLSHPDREV